MSLIIALIVIGVFFLSAVFCGIHKYMNAHNREVEYKVIAENAEAAKMKKQIQELSRRP